MVFAAGEDDGNLSGMFQKELQKRNISSADDISEESSRDSYVPPPGFIGEYEDPPQLQKSRELNSEGLEGLVPRGSQLLQLGLSFFLAFGPFIAVVLAAFGVVYFVRVSSSCP